jgi:hypothetical protein
MHLERHGNQAVAKARESIRLRLFSSSHDRQIEESPGTKTKVVNDATDKIRGLVSFLLIRDGTRKPRATQRR